MTTPEAKVLWTEANQASLSNELARLKRLLGCTTGCTTTGEAWEESTACPQPSAIDSLSELFGLSPFERGVLLLCAGVEMDSHLATRCSEAQGHPQRAYATFGLALSTLPEAHWSALTPDRPLRRFRLLEVEPGHSLTTTPLRIDERILHYLAGVNRLDHRLQSLLQESAFPEWIAESHAAIAEQAVLVLATNSQDPPVLHFCGDDLQGQEDIAFLAARGIGRHLFTLRGEDIPAPGADLDQFALLWHRETLLLRGALLLQCGSSGLTPSARRLAERLPLPLILAGREPVRLNRSFLRFDVDKPVPTEQKRLWERSLETNGANFDGALDSLAEQFRLSAKTIFCAGALAAADANTRVGVEDLWRLCRSFARPKLDDLAQRLAPKAGWDDLVLPQRQMQTLHQLASQVSYRMKVYETWGFSDKGRRGLGLSSLFAGESGTGKTLAAEVLARELNLDLYRIDLSAVVSKYIGETEKNLKQVFDASEEGGILLLFDEADALFGKRSDVKDSHDRYANIEVSYLLQRMEAYQGLAVLTTNLKSAIDNAFQRRLRFTVIFPFPDAAQRQAIWSRVFPARTPTHDLDFRKLSQLNITGGNIRNIALNAAFLAAESSGRVEMGHVLTAARLEADRIERPLSEAEIRGWV
jgi:hypothetical protein